MGEWRLLSLNRNCPCLDNLGWCSVEVAFSTFHSGLGTFVAKTVADGG